MTMRTRLAGLAGRCSRKTLIVMAVISLLGAAAAVHAIGGDRYTPAAPQGQAATGTRGPASSAFDGSALAGDATGQDQTGLDQAGDATGFDQPGGAAAGGDGNSGDTQPVYTPNIDDLTGPTVDYGYDTGS